MMKSMRRTPGIVGFSAAILRRSALLAFSFLWMASTASADDYPVKAIHLLIPTVVGGPADIVGRLYAKYLSQLTGQPVVVENPAGASGVIGTEKAMRAEPDGYTLVLGTTSTMAGINQIFMKNLPYNFERDFETIGLIASAPHVLAVRASLGVESFADLVTIVHKSPGKYTFSSAGPGTIVQMGGELMKYYAGMDILHVPFKGGAPATMAVIAGTVDMTVNDLTTLRTHIDSGQLRPLAVASTARLKLLPGIPTFAELGYPKIVSSTWWGIAVPKGTSKGVLSKLRAVHSKIIAAPEFVSQLEAMSVEPLHLSPIQTVAFIHADKQKWESLAAAAKIGHD